MVRVGRHWAKSPRSRTTVLINLAKQYLKDHGESLAEYDDNCGELANVLQMVTPNSHIVSVSDIAVFDTTGWTYHTVVMLDGMIHDAWRKRADFRG